MEEKIKKSKYVLITVVLLLILSLNAFWWHSAVIGISFGLAYLAFYSLIAGSIFIAKRGWHLVLGLVFILSLVAIIGTAAIYLYQFNNYLFCVALLTIPVLLVTPYYQINLKEKLSFRQTVKKYVERFTTRQESKINSALVAAYLFIAAFCFLFLIEGQTFISIQTPWQVVRPEFWLFYFLGSAVLLTYLFNSTRTKLPLALISLHTFLSTSVALIVYGVGFGYDPFIHQATEKIILDTGTISPIPPYYLGQYAMVIFLSKLFQINYIIVDKALVPLLTAIVIPTSIFYVFSHWIKKNYALVIALLALAIPYTSFIMTAPQNLANLFFIFTILLSLLYFRNQIRIEILYVLALATIAIHPLAGLPLLIAVILFNLFKLLFSSYKHYLSLFFLTALVFVMVMPLVFIANGSGIELNLPDAKTVILDLVSWVDKFDLPLNIVYLISYNRTLLAIALILLGLAYLSNHKLLRNNSAYFVAAIIIFLNYLITKYLITFPALSDHDQPDFVNRLLLLTFYVLLPFFLLGLYWLIKNIWTKDIIFKVFLIFCLAGLLTSSLYLSYPHLDQYGPAKFFSLSLSDIKAVNYIEKTAAPNHIVLANQMIGLAAIKRFGFKHYVNGQFFYSMPNGNPRTFYDSYLAMIEGTDIKNTIAKTLAESGADEIYFVVNKYWNGAEKIVANVRPTADEMYIVDNGQVYIFKYIAFKL